MDVDVILLTRNSVRPCLKSTIMSIYNNVPVNRLIVVDGYSTDDTVKTIKEFKKKIKWIYDDGTRATARQKGIEAVETEYFVFVDSDVILCKDWFRKAVNLMKEDVGAVWGIAIPQQKTRRNWIQAKSKLFGLTIAEHYLKEGNMRGLMHDTLIKTESVKDICIPSELHYIEDEYIKQHIQSQGYKWLSTSNPFCFHLKPKQHIYHVFKDAYQTTALGKRYGYGFSSNKQFMKHCLFFIPKIYLSLLISRNAEIVSLNAFRELGFICGFTIPTGFPSFLGDQKRN